jgi:hypothetical protein
MRAAAMVVPEPGQHVLITVGVEDAIQDGVVVPAQHIASYLVYQPDVDSVGDIPLPEDRPADEILRDPGNTASAVGLTKGFRDGALS